MPFPDASFDIVVSTLVLCTVSNVDQCLAEMRRVLRPDGELLFIEHVRGTGGLGTLHDVIRPVWSWVAAGCQPNRRTEESLAAAGWDVVIDDRRRMAGMLPLLRGRATPPT